MAKPQTNIFAVANTANISSSAGMRSIQIIIPINQMHGENGVSIESNWMAECYDQLS